MKYLSIGNFDKKILIIFFFFIIILLSIALIDKYYFLKLEFISINIALNMIIDSGFNVIFAIFEFIIMKRNKAKKGKSNIKIYNKIFRKKR